MNTRRRLFAAAGAVLASTLAVGTVGFIDSGADAAGSSTYAVTVTVENLAPETGTIQTPFWVAVHDGGFDTYDRNAAVSPELERLAEDGNTGPLAGLFGETGNGQDTTIFGPGPIFPGAKSSHTFIVDATDPASRYFSYASMVIPSNDAFISNGNPMAHQLFDDGGNVVAADFVVLGSEVLDAGSEVNDEIPENTAALAQAAPDTGIDEEGTVQLHPGFIPGGNVLSAIPGGDFTAANYEAAAISFEITAVDTSNRIIFSVLDGFQEVEPVETRSLGYGLFRVREGGDRINVDVQFWNTADVVAAHLHLGARGENGPVVATLFSGPGSGLSDGSEVDGTIRAGDLVGPLAGMPLQLLLAEIDAGNIYINVHTKANPSGEIRGQLVS